MLDAVVEYLPSPTEVKAIEGELENGEKGHQEPLMMQHHLPRWPLKLPPIPLWAR